MFGRGSSRFLKEVRRWSAPRARTGGWASWAAALRGDWGRRIGRFGTPWAVLPHAATGAATAGGRGPAGPRGPSGQSGLRAATAPVRVSMMQSVVRPARVERVAPSSASPARLPAPGRPAPVRPATLTRSERTVVREAIEAREPRVPVSMALPRTAAGPVIGTRPVVAMRTNAIVRERAIAPPLTVWRRPAATQVATTTTAALALTRRVIEERTRREVYSMVGSPIRHRIAAPAAAAHAAAAGAAGPSSPTTRGRRPTANEEAYTSTPMLPIDVDRLTDQVVRRIDDRINAYRERLGRAF